jgi:hypothetical protein
MPTLQNSSDIAGANQVLGGTHNTAPNQTWVVAQPNDLINFTQYAIMSANNTFCYPPLSTANGWAVGTETGGATAALLGYYGQVISSTTNPDSSSFYGNWFNGPYQIGGTSSSLEADFSRAFVWTFKLHTSVTAALPNTILRISIGKAAASTPTLGDLTIVGIQCKFLFSASNTMSLYGQVYSVAGGLSTSASALGTLTNTSQNPQHVINVYSDGAGNVSFYIDEVLAGTMTGGPTTVSTTSNTCSFVAEISNTGDSTTAYVPIVPISVTVLK